MTAPKHKTASTLRSTSPPCPIVLVTSFRSMTVVVTCLGSWMVDVTCFGTGIVTVVCRRAPPACVAQRT